jgi:Asp-tRNA(Asn)/Glu-tRNA(Gln) amidotransferase A subunit family amidase
LCAWKAWFAIADAFCDFSIRSSGPKATAVSPGAPPVCEMFRHYPDALERATELDAQYGSNSPLDEMPMYGIVFSFKDPFDTKDVRTTASGDATDHEAGVEAV